MINVTKSKKVILFFVYVILLKISIEILESETKWNFNRSIDGFWRFFLLGYVIRLWLWGWNKAGLISVELYKKMIS